MRMVKNIRNYSGKKEEKPSIYEFIFIVGHYININRDLDFWNRDAVETGIETLYKLLN